MALDDQDSEAPAPESRIYGAMLDEETCPACAEQAGIEYPADDPAGPAIPNPRCTHVHGCRCGWL